MLVRIAMQVRIASKDINEVVLVYKDSNGKDSNAGKNSNVSKDS